MATNQVKMDYSGDLRFRKYNQISDETTKSHEKSVVTHLSEIWILTKLGSIESNNLITDEIYLKTANTSSFGVKFESKVTEEEST